MTNQILTFNTLWIYIKNALQNHIPFLVTDATLASKSFTFQKEYFRKNIKTNHKDENEKQQYDINSEPARISAWSCEKLINMKILEVKKLISYRWRNIPNIKGQIMQQAKFAYCSLGKALEKWIEKQVGAIESLTKPF